MRRAEVWKVLRPIGAAARSSILDEANILCSCEKGSDRRRRVEMGDIQTVAKDEWARGKEVESLMRGFWHSFGPEK